MMTREELRVDALRSWLFAVAMLSTGRNIDEAWPMFKRLAEENGVPVE